MENGAKEVSDEKEEPPEEYEVEEIVDYQYCRQSVSAQNNKPLQM